MVGHGRAEKRKGAGLSVVILLGIWTAASSSAGGSAHDASPRAARLGEASYFLRQH